MLSKISVIFFTLTVCAKSQIIQLTHTGERQEVLGEDRIVGGERAQLGEFPFIVSILTMLGDTNNGMACGGTIYNSRTIVTAAHCFHDYERGKKYLSYIWAGRTNFEHIMVPVESEKESSQMAMASDVIVHENYTGRTNVSNAINDIAIIILQQDFRWSDTVQPVVLANNDEIENAKTTQFIGWGNLDDNGTAATHLNKVSLPLADFSECSHFWNTSATRQLCVAGGPRGKGPCSGDSGGPGMIKSNGCLKQAGVHSFGLSKACYVGNAVLTKVPHYADWIRENAKGDPQGHCQEG